MLRETLDLTARESEYLKWLYLLAEAKHQNTRVKAMNWIQTYRKYKQKFGKWST
jgi:hypothetical protein